MNVLSVPRHDRSRCSVRSWESTNRPGKLYRLLLLGALWIVALAGTNLGRVGAVQTDEEDFRSELPRFVPLEPSEAIGAFEVAEGFQIELVAAEPLVVDPVAFWFHPNGRLFVIEMIDYSEQDREQLGRVAVLYDDNDDGKMDRRTTFVDGLSWPTAIHGWRDGVIVIAPPDVIFLRDIDGDGICDQRETWFTGFARNNVQGMANSLRWTVEGYIEGTSSSNGGMVLDSYGNQVDLKGRDFRMDPVTRTITSTSGGGQHGMCFNVWGDKFVTSNSDHLQQIIDLESWLSQQSPRIPVPSSRRSIASDGMQAEVYRISPIEPWRIVRTRLRVEGRVPGPIEGGGRAAGYFTGATGTWIMPGDGPFGFQGHDVAFVCDVGSNLVHRKKLTEQGLYYRADRIDPNSEFVRSRDTWFRPVQLGDGPDGNLYIADMYREVIEHPLSLPPVIKKHLDLTSGRDRGRIYRVRPTRQNDLPSLCSNARSSRELASLLEHDLPWQRLAAQQLLLENHAIDAREALEELARHSQKPESRLLAYATLRRLGCWSTNMAQFGLEDADEHVVAVNLRWLDAVSFTAMEEHVQNVVGRFQSERIELEIAKRIGEASDATYRWWLSRALPKEWESLITAIAADSMLRHSVLTFDALLQSSTTEISGRNQVVKWFRMLLPIWLKAINRNDASIVSVEFRERFSKVLNELLKDETWRIDLSNAVSELSSAERLAFSTILDPDVGRDLRAWTWEHVQPVLVGKLPQIDALRWSWLLAAEDRSSVVRAILHPRTETSLLPIFFRHFLTDEPELGYQATLETLPNLLPEQRAILIDILLEHQRSSRKLAMEIDSGAVPKRWLNASQSERLQIVLSPEERERWNEGKQPSSRWTDDQIRLKAETLERLLKDDQQVLHRYEIGKSIFTRECASCHRFQDLGKEVGPPLKSVVDKSIEQILMALLDPNREIDPRYELHAILTLDGRVFSGVLASESANSVEMRSNGGERNVIARSEIEQLRNLGTSMMPSDLDGRMNDDEMASLIAFLRHVEE